MRTAAAGYLQQARELAVPEVHVLGPAAAFLAERVDAVAERQQGAVDVGALLHPLTAVLGLGGRGRGPHYARTPLPPKQPALPTAWGLGVGARTL